MDRGAWQAIVHGIAKSQTPLKWLRVHVSTFASPSAVAGFLSMWGLCDKQADFCPFQAWFYWQRHTTLLETKWFFCSVINKLIHRQSAPSASFPFNPSTICSGSLVDLLIVFQQRLERKNKKHSICIHTSQWLQLRAKSETNKWSGPSTSCLKKPGTFRAQQTPKFCPLTAFRESLWWS